MNDLPTIGLKPSELLRKGCEMQPVQSRGPSDAVHLSACAIQAIGLADLGWDEDGRCDRAIWRGYDIVGANGIEPGEIWRRNDGWFDGRRWTREEIADWLEAQGL